MSGSNGVGALPDGWVHTTMGQVSQVVGGGTPKTSIPGNFTDDDGHPWLTPADLTGYHEKHISRGRRNLTDQGLAGSSAKYMPAGTILFSSRAPVGYVVVADGPITTNQGFRSFVPSDALDSDYAYHYLSSITALAERLASGTTFNELSGTKAKALPLVLPPFAEQQRIAAHLDKVATRRAAAAEHLGVAESVLPRLRAAIIAAACAGRLTEDVRLDSGGEAGEVPLSWRHATLGELTDSIRGGSGEVPTGSITDFPVLRSSSVRPLRIIYDDVRYLSREQSQKAANFVEDGDLLVTRLNGNIEYVGNAALVDGLGDRRLQYPDRLFRLRLKEQAHAQYVQLFFASPHARAQIRAASRSAAGHQRISISDLKGFSIDLPPLDEQHEIVLRANAMLATAAHITDRVNQTATAMDRVFDACLAKAFRGQLVPTEAALAEAHGRDFESAEHLLARAQHSSASTMNARRTVGRVR